MGKERRWNVEPELVDIRLVYQASGLNVAG
jgi:hypothetical protein